MFPIGIWIFYYCYLLFHPALHSLSLPMHFSRRRKIWLSSLLLVILVLVTGYMFRYPLMLQFQYSRIKSLHCHDRMGRQMDCRERIWVHRVNSTERYDVLKNKFNGFETDIAYRNSMHAFSVYHPPVDGIDDTLSLARFLSSIDLKHKKIWFDTRYLDTSNMKEALQALSALDRSGLVQKNCILEIYDAAAAGFFAANGYSVSFNMSPELISQMEKKTAVKDSVSRYLEQVAYVSQEAGYLGAIKKLFPARQILTWDSHFSSFFDTASLQQLLDDPQIAIILVNIKSRFYR